MELYYGLTSFSQLKRLPRDMNILVSARMLIKMSISTVAYKYISEFRSVMLDSGAFGCAFWDGGYTYNTDDYLRIVEKVMPEYWVTMDVPCEPNIMPHLSVLERIKKTVENTEILSTAPFSGFLPVIQGWEVEEYLHCIDLLEGAGQIKPIMGIGSICRRGKQEQILNIVRHISQRLPSIKFHAFGIKINTLNYNHGEILNYLDSLDTAAWQFNGKDELGGWRPRTYQEIYRRLLGYKEKLNKRVSGPHQLVLR